MGGLLSHRTQVTLTHVNLRIILNKQEFIVNLGLRSSYLGHRVKKISLNSIRHYQVRVILFMVRSYAILIA